MYTITLKRKKFKQSHRSYCWDKENLCFTSKAVTGNRDSIVARQWQDFCSQLVALLNYTVTKVCMSLFHENVMSLKDSGSQKTRGNRTKYSDTGRFSEKLSSPGVKLPKRKGMQ